VSVLCPCVPVLLIGNRSTGRTSANRGKVCLGCKVASDSYCDSTCVFMFKHFSVTRIPLHLKTEIILFKDNNIRMHTI